MNRDKDIGRGRDSDKARWRLDLTMGHRRSRSARQTESTSRSRNRPEYVLSDEERANPAEEDEMMDAILADVDTGAWLETAVDACRSERDDALVRYRKGVERKARLNKA